MHEFLTVRQAAYTYGVTKPCIYQAIQAGKLNVFRLKTGKKLTDRLYLKKDDLEIYRDNRHNPRERKHKGQKILEEGQTSPMIIAEELSVKPQTIYYGIYKKKIPYTRKGSSYILKTEDVINYLNDHQPRKYPKRSKRISKSLK